MVTAGEARTEDGRQWRGMIATTRPVRLRDEDRVVTFARTALDGMAQQINEVFVSLNYEHLEFMPPIGRIDNATVIIAEDGESELQITGSDMCNRFVSLARDPFALPSESPDVGSPDLSISIMYEPRNFEDHVAQTIQDDLGDKAHPVERWAQLPPLEFAILIPVVWGAIRFAGAFLDELGRSLGAEIGARIATWSRRSKQPSRTVVFSLRFEIHDGSSINGFVLASSGNVELAVNSALDASEELATIAGIQRQANVLPSMKESAFFLEDGRWHLGWWTDGESVFHTRWFAENQPDVDGVLGHGEAGSADGTARQS